LGRRDFSTHYCYGRDGAGGSAGAIGAEPGALPVVLGGVAGRGNIGELIGAVALGALLAVLLFLFQPAIRMIAIKTTTAMPAIQPHMPPDVSGRCSTGLLSRWPNCGSDMTILLGFPDVAPRSRERTTSL
jgi:hypothetical protein